VVVLDENPALGVLDPVPGDRSGRAGALNDNAGPNIADVVVGNVEIGVSGPRIALYGNGRVACIGRIGTVDFPLISCDWPREGRVADGHIVVADRNAGLSGTQVDDRAGFARQRQTVLVDARPGRVVAGPDVDRRAGQGDVDAVLDDAAITDADLAGLA